MSNAIDNPKALTEDFKDLEKTLLEVNEKIKNLGQGKETDQFKELPKHIQGVSGAFSAATGTLKLFGAESKSLGEVETKITGLVGVIGNLQMGFKTLGKTGGGISLLTDLIAGLVGWYEQWGIKNEAVSVTKATLSNDKSVAKKNNAGVTDAKKESNPTLDENKPQKETKQKSGGVNTTIINQQKKLNDQLFGLQTETERSRTARLEEGAAKECAIILNTYNEKIALVNRLEADLKNARNGKLTSDEQSILDNARQEAEVTRNQSEDKVYKKENESAKQEIEAQKKAEEDAFNALLAKYEDYTAKRLGIKTKYENDIKALEAEREKADASGNTDKVKKIDQSIAQAQTDKGVGLISFDLSILKESETFTWAFENLKNTSTETLKALLEQLGSIKDESTEVVNPEKLKEYTGYIQKILDEMGTRNPVKAMVSAQNQLTQANTRLSNAKKGLNEAMKSEDPEAIVKAKSEHASALIDVDKANKKVEKSQKEVNGKMGDLFKHLSAVGQAIGGQEGKIISLIGDIGSFVSTSISGIQTTAKAGAGALSAVEKASAILAIIQMAIVLISKISSLISSSHQQYEKFAKKLAEINKLRDAVNEYEIAVLKAKQAENNWFGSDRLQELKDSSEVNAKVKEDYHEKVTEQQATYVNKDGEGWGSKWVKEAMTPTAMMAAGNIKGGLDRHKSSKSPGYDKGTSMAIDNLRIETRKEKKGFLGSGIGGQSQQTKDLRTWAKENNFGELFDDKNMINRQAAQKIIDTYGDKLTGETKATLEALIELSKQYEEHQQKLQEYISSLYEPLVDNLVDSLWSWFDEGKNALTSFKDMASDTFRDIVTDMLKTIVLQKVVGNYSDEVLAMYNDYAEGKITEEQLMEQVAKRTDQLIQDYEHQLPALQGIITTIGGGLNEIGIDIKKPGPDKQQQSEKGSFQTMSQDTGSELLGQFTAIRIHTSNIHELIRGLQNEDRNLTNHLEAIEKNTYSTVTELREVNKKLKHITVEGVKVL